MTVCAFYAKGNCRYGNNCKYEHIGGDNKKNNSLPGPDSFSIIAKSIQDDLSTEKPAYYLSVYAAQKSIPNLIGDTDLSPEELRFQAYQARANNTVAQYVAHESQLLQQMDSVIQMVCSNSHESYKHFYHTQIPLNHPNSTFRKATPGVTAFGGNSFGSPNSTLASQQPSSTITFNAFGKQAPATTVSAFGQPSPVMPGVSAFGQQSSFGKSLAQPTTVTAFGNPFTMGSAAPAASAFGSTTTAPAASAFGSTPTAPVASAFGTASTAPAVSAFGPAATTSAFGSAPATSAFGSATMASAFGQPSQFGVTTFGANPTQPSIFGGNAQPTNTSTATAFGQTGASINTGTVTAFGQTNLNQSTTAFGQPASTTPASSFGQSSPFGQPQATSAFGKPSAFGQSAFSGASMNPTSTATTAFGQSAFGGSTTAFGQNSSVPVNSQPTNSGGFAAFAGNTSAPTLVTTDTGMGSTTPTDFSEDNKSQPQSFQQVSAPAPVTPPFQQANNQYPAKQLATNAGNSKLIERLKNLDPFWEDAPTESNLPPDVLEAFKADSFSLDLIPNVPPPIALR